MVHRIFSLPFGELYPLYLAKVERKGQPAENLDKVIEWLTGYDASALAAARESGITLEEFFAGAPVLNPDRELITGKICGVRVEAIEDPLMQNIRYLDKLVDEVAQGRAMDKILRSRD